MVNVASTAQTLSDDYAALGNWIGLATANTDGMPLEVPVGAANYERVQTTWTSGSGGVNNGKPVTLNAPAGQYTFVILCSAKTDSTQSGDTLLDYCKINPPPLNYDGQIVVTPQFTQT